MHFMTPSAAAKWGRRRGCKRGLESGEGGGRNKVELQTAL